jgi:N-methylhydantoinase B
VPVEILEASMPILFTRKELHPGTGGKGATQGGDGQIISFNMRTKSEWLLNAVTSRTTLAPEGLEGGEPGMAGRFLINGEPVSNARKIVMQPNDVVTLDTPGGGGYGRAASLPRAAE